MDTFIVHVDDVEEIEGAYRAPFDGEKLSIYRDIGRAAGSKNIGFGWERLLPGRRTSFTHAHSEEEEFVFVLSGQCHVRVIEPGSEPREIPLRAGHAVSFPAGTGIAHTFVNRGTEECRLFIVGERRDTDRFFIRKILNTTLTTPSITRNAIGPAEKHAMTSSRPRCAGCST